MRILFLWKGSLAPRVFSGFIIWYSIMLHVFFVVLNIYHSTDSSCSWKGGADCTGLPVMPNELISPAVDITTFFVVFYVSECFFRFKEMHRHCTAINGEVLQWTAMVRLQVDGKNRQWDCVRHVLTSVHLFYYNLRDCSGDGHHGLNHMQWKVLCDRYLITPAEAQLLKTYTGSKTLVPFTWSMDSLQRNLAQHPDRFETLRDFKDLMCSIRGHCVAVSGMLNEPVPLAYMNMLLIMICIVQLCAPSLERSPARPADAHTCWRVLAGCLPTRPRRWPSGR